MISLLNEPEIFESDREKPQILDGNNYVENAQIAVGFASKCWDEKGVFNERKAMRISNELCAYMRLLKEGKEVSDNG